MGTSNGKLIKEMEEKIKEIDNSRQEEKEAMNNREQQIKQQLEKRIDSLNAKNLDKEEHVAELEKLIQANDAKLKQLEQQREADKLKYENDIKEWKMKTIEITKNLEKGNLKNTAIHTVNLINSNIKLYTIQKEKCIAVFDEYKDELLQIKREEKRLNKFFVEENKDNNLLNVVLIGITGHGKSSFGSRLLGDKSKDCNGKVTFLKYMRGKPKIKSFKHNDTVNSETQDITKRIVRRVWKKDLSVTDTPGIFDSGGKDVNHSNSIIKFLRGCGGVNAFLLVKTRHPPRIDMAFKDSLKSLEVLLGRAFWRHVIMIITHTRGKDANKEKFKKYSQCFRDTILNDMNLTPDEAPLPFIGVDSFENYKEPIKELIKTIPDKRFLCDELRSPLDELKIKNKNMKVIFENTKAELDGIQNIIHVYKEELNVATLRLKEMDPTYIEKRIDLSALNEEKNEWEITIDDISDDSDDEGKEVENAAESVPDESDDNELQNIEWVLDDEYAKVYYGELDTGDDITVRLTDLAHKNPRTIQLNVDSDKYDLWVEKFTELQDEGVDIEVTVKTVVYKNKDKETETRIEHSVKNVNTAQIDK